MTTRQEKPVEPFPTLLTKADAYIFCAVRLEAMIADLELMVLLADVGKSKSELSNDPNFEKLRVMMSGVVDKDIQLAAMCDAARSLRDLASEIRLVEARAARDGIKIKEVGS